MTEPHLYDVAIIGGGAAGLSAALTLGRARRSVVVLDAGQPRNAPAAGAHNLLGNEGIAPLDLLARGRDEARSYGAHIVSATVTGASGSAAEGFTLTTQPIPSAAEGGVTHATEAIPEPAASATSFTVARSNICSCWAVRETFSVSSASSSSCRSTT